MKLKGILLFFISISAFGSLANSSSVNNIDVPPNRRCEKFRDVTGVHAPESTTSDGAAELTSEQKDALFKKFVPSLFKLKSDLTCTGTLTDKYVIFSAAHCSRWGDFRNGSAISEAPSKGTVSTRIEVHQHTSPSNSTLDIFSKHIDAEIHHIEGALPTDTVPVKVDHTPVKDGEVVLIVGSVCPTMLNCRLTFLAVKVDPLGTRPCGFIPGYYKRSFTFLEGYIYPGLSGGPVLRYNKNRELVLIGNLNGGLGFNITELSHFATRAFNVGFYTEIAAFEPIMNNLKK